MSFALDALLIDFFDLDFEDETTRYLDEEDRRQGDWRGDLWLSEEEREAERRERALIFPVLGSRGGGRSFKESCCLSYI